MNLTATLVEIRNQMGLRVDFTVVMMTMALLMARILPVLVLTPMLGGETTPTEVKIGIGVTLGLVLFPALSARFQYVPISALPFIAIMLKEIFIGLCISFIVDMIFEAATVAGTLIDTMAGTNMAQVMVPQLGQQVSLFSSLQLQLTVTLFLTLNGHHLVIEAFADSLQSIPLDQFPKFSQGVWPFFELILRVAGDMIKVSVALAAPVMLAAFMTDLALGLINRAAPQVQVFFISMQIKPMASVLVMLATFHLVLARMVGEFSTMLQWLKEALHLLA